MEPPPVVVTPPPVVVTPPPVVTPPTIDPAVLRDQRIIAIRALSVQYFGQQSSDNAAVEKQIAYLAAGNSESALGILFARVKADWIAETGSAPPEYFWVDRGMNYLIDGGTDAQYRAEIQKVLPGLLRDQRIIKIRALSVQYFGQQSSDNAAVEKQIAYLAAGNSEASLAAMFSATLQAWISVYGAPPPDYSWVDTAMNYRLNGGTEAQYLNEVKKTVGKTFPLQGIRTISIKYFGMISADSEAVGRQQLFLLGSGTLDQLENYFAIVKRSWIAETGAPPPAYFWVDRGVTFQLNTGTEEQYRNEIRKLNGNY